MEEAETGRDAGLGAGSAGAHSFFYEAELLRLKAVVCVHRTSAAEAKDLFSAALRAATAQGARAL
jgi:hypothetical protein